MCHKATKGNEKTHNGERRLHWSADPGIARIKPPSVVYLHWITRYVLNYRSYLECKCRSGGILI